MYVLFLDGPMLLLKTSPPGFIDKLFALIKRAVRFMMCFDSELINKVTACTLGSTVGLTYILRL